MQKKSQFQQLQQQQIYQSSPDQQRRFLQEKTSPTKKLSFQGQKQVSQLQSQLQSSMVSSQNNSSAQSSQQIKDNSSYDNSLQKSQNYNFDNDAESPTKTDPLEKYVQKYGIDYEELQALEQAFKYFDVDDSKSLTISEMNQAMKALGFQLDSEDIQRMFSDLDKDNDRKIGFEEFLKPFVQPFFVTDNEKDMVKVFGWFDEIDGNKNGYINVKNLRLLAKELGEKIDEQELYGMINLADSDKDGQVDESDFVSFFMKYKSIHIQEQKKKEQTSEKQKTKSKSKNKKQIQFN